MLVSPDRGWHTDLSKEASERPKPDEPSTRRSLHTITGAALLLILW